MKFNETVNLTPIQFYFHVQTRECAIQSHCKFLSLIRMQFPTIHKKKCYFIEWNSLLSLSVVFVVAALRANTFFCCSFFHSLFFYIWFSLFCYPFSVHYSLKCHLNDNAVDIQPFRFQTVNIGVLIVIR